MLQTLLIALSSFGLILFVAFVGARLLRSRTAGLSIRMQVFIALASIVGAFAFGVGVLVLDRVKARATLLAEESARSEASAIAALVQNDMKVRDRDLEAVAQDLSVLSPDVGVTLLAVDGRAVLIPASPEYQGGAPGSVAVTVPIEVDGARVGSVQVVKRTLEIQRTLEDFAPTILIISLGLGVAAAISAALIGRTIASPIEKLTDFAVRVSEGQLFASPPAAPHGREVMRLTQALEIMRRELEGRPFVETFAADLSHELKNPVAAIRASAEVLADGALEEPAEAARFVQRIQEATARIELLLGELLSLARIEARGVEDARVVDLRGVAQEAAARARDRGAKVEVHGVSSLVKGDEPWLARLVDNLLDNALVHGLDKGPVRLILSRSGEQVSLSVENPGAVSEHVRKKLFRRFVTTRPDKGGTGLGLAIVRAVAESHGGTVRCETAGPPSVIFVVKLPAARQSLLTREPSVDK
ncbi:MAG: GHKL domain-containing protein [Polyangiaceae bacterium]|nr:GHKL domain-containing protein [Polyangiaceae bacterium]